VKVNVGKEHFNEVHEVGKILKTSGREPPSNVTRKVWT
jgi:hypothetical protein